MLEPQQAISHVERLGRQNIRRKSSKLVKSTDASKTQPPVEGTKSPAKRPVTSKYVTLLKKAMLEMEDMKKFFKSA